MPMKKKQIPSNKEEKQYASSNIRKTTHEFPSYHAITVGSPIPWY